MKIHGSIIHKGQNLVKGQMSISSKMDKLYSITEFQKYHMKQKKWGRELHGCIYIKLKNQAKLKHKVKDSVYL